jgi:hypothetical protein
MWNISNKIWPKGMLWGKLDRYKDHIISWELPVNKTLEISTYLAVDCPEFKTNRMSTNFLHTESAAICIYHMQMKMNYYYIWKERWQWRPSNHPVFHKVNSWWITTNCWKRYLQETQTHSWYKFKDTCMGDSTISFILFPTQ